jgi:hypothetical protein
MMSYNFLKKLFFDINHNSLEFTRFQENGTLERCKGFLFIFPQNFEFLYLVRRWDLFVAENVVTPFVIIDTYWP